MDLLQQSNNVEKLLRGMIRQPVEKADSNFVDDVSTPIPWLTLLLVLVKSRVNQKLC